MYRGSRNFKAPKAPRTRINEMVRISPVRLIDQDGNQVGVIETAKALKMAQEAGLDLVEISPKTRPPVCKIIDWGKYQYEQSKKQRKSKGKQSKVEIKGVRIRPSTDRNDLAFKTNQAIKFLEKGNKVKVEIVLRGREKAFMPQAKDKLRGFVDKIDFPYKIEQSAQKQFNGFNVIIAPK